MRNLDSAHMAFFKKSFLECALGRSVVASASLLLQVTAKEEAANRKLARAMQGLEMCGSRGLSWIPARAPQHAQSFATSA